MHNILKNVMFCNHFLYLNFSAFFSDVSSIHLLSTAQLDEEKAFWAVTINSVTKIVYKTRFEFVGGGVRLRSRDRPWPKNM